MALLLDTAGDRAAQALGILQYVATAGALFSLARWVAGPWAAGICTLGYATVPPAIYFAGCGYVEPALLMTLGSSLLALGLFVLPRPDGLMPGKLALREGLFVGFLAGWMPALKYTGMIYLGLMAILLLWSQRKEPTRVALKIIGAFALGAAPGLCWVAWNWMNLGNPVYPLAYSFFGGKGWDDVRDRAMSLYFHGFGMGREAKDYLLLPWRFSFLGGFDSVHFDGAMGPFLLIFLTLAIAAAIRMVRRRVNQKMLGGMGFVLLTSVAFFILGNQQARFWLPSQFLACFYAAPIVALIQKWARSRRTLKLLIGLVVVASLAWNGWFLVRQVVVVGYHKPVLGWEQESSFLKRIVPGYPAMEFINQHVPPSSRVLCVWTGAYGYYLDRPYYSDTFLEDVTFKHFIDASRDGRELSQSLAKNGFTHLFVRKSLLQETMTPQQLEIFSNFLKKETRELFCHGGFSVFEISAGMNLP
jgi:4-amino-4-deoxy-L-arabinose transferase-like glycosyltransferase